MESTELNQKEKLYNTLLREPKIVKKAYELLIEDWKAVEKYFLSWKEAGLQEIEYEEYRKKFVILHKTIKNAKLRAFQYRLLLNKIVTNIDLKKWKIISSDQCSLCKLAPETSIHLLYNCPVIQETVEYIDSICNTCNIGVTWSVENFILGNIAENPFHIINFMCIIAKQLVYRCRCMNTKFSITLFKQEMESIYDMELFNSKWNNKLGIHVRRWSPIKPGLIEMSTGENIV